MTATRGTAKPDPSSEAAAGKAERTRRRILDAAAEVLTTRGYAGTRLSEIAEVAQLQAPAIYYHFASREELIEAVITTGQQRTYDYVTEAIAAAPAGSTYLEKILIAVRAHLELCLMQSAYASASVRNLGQLPDAARQRQVELRRDYGAVWHDLFEAGVAAGEFDPALNPGASRMLILGALNWTPEWWSPERGSAESVIAEAQRMVRAALKA